MRAANDLHLLELAAKNQPLHLFYIFFICRGIAQQHVCFSAHICVCLSMSILLKRDMSSSPRKLPQARNNTTVSANNQRCAYVCKCVCVMEAGGGTSLIYR